MRTVTFSDATVRELVETSFECAWTNMRPDVRFRPGLDRSFDSSQVARNFPNGTGSDNIRAIFATPDQKVLHVLPGYCDPATFRREIEFVLKLREAALDENYKLREDGLESFESLHRGRAEEHRLRLRDPETPAFRRAGEQVLAHAHQYFARMGPLRIDELKLETW